MKKSYTYILFLIAFLLTSCLKEDDNSGTITYNDAEYDYEIDLLEDDWFKEIRRYDTTGVLQLTMRYEYDSARIIKRIYDGDDNLTQAHHYYVDTNNRAVESFDTIFNKDGSGEVNHLVYKKDTTNNKLKTIEHTFEDEEYTYTFTYENNDLQFIERSSSIRTCNDQYIYTDSAQVLDIYSFREDKAFAFDSRIIGNQSEHLTQAISLNYNCYSQGIVAPEVHMHYDLNTDKKVKTVVYVIFPAHNMYNTDITADRITHNFTYNYVE